MLICRHSPLPNHSRPAPPRLQQQRSLQLRQLASWLLLYKAQQLLMLPSQKLLELLPAPQRAKRHPCLPKQQQTSGLSRPHRQTPSTQTSPSSIQWSRSALRKTR